MEPKLPAPNFGHESAPTGYGQNIERAPAPASPEIGMERRPEQVEQRAEARSAAELAAPVLPPPVIAVPQPVAPPDPVQPDAPSDDLPLVANDDDLIEK